MKKVLLAITALVFTAIYIVSSSEPMMKFIAPYRYKLNSAFGSDKYTYGDLYGISYLPQFRIKQPPAGQIHINVPASKRDINLFALVDSHVYAFVKSDSIFYGVKNYWYTKWADSAKNETVRINPKQKNVLLIESVEHYAGLLGDTNRSFNKLRAVSADAPQKAIKTVHASSGSFFDMLKNIFFDKAISENLEFNLFNYRFFSPLKELKAEFNYRLFNRVDKDVQVSKNGRFLFQKVTLDTGYQSSFHPIAQKQVDKIVNGLNAVYGHYRSLGFSEVYLTIVPNPVSMLQQNSGRYNYLVPRIQNDPRLKLKVIDLYSMYKNDPGKVYRQSDSHYTNEGFKIWVDAFNKQLMEADKNNKFDNGKN